MFSKTTLLLALTSQALAGCIDSLQQINNQPQDAINSLTAGGLSEHEAETLVNGLGLPEFQDAVCTLLDTGDFNDDTDPADFIPALADNLDLIPDEDLAVVQSVLADATAGPQRREAAPVVTPAPTITPAPVLRMARRDATSSTKTCASTDDVCDGEVYWHFEPAVATAYAKALQNSAFSVALAELESAFQPRSTSGYDYNYFTRLFANATALPASDRAVFTSVGQMVVDAQKSVDAAKTGGSSASNTMATSVSASHSAESSASASASASAS